MSGAYKIHHSSASHGLELTCRVSFVFLLVKFVMMELVHVPPAAGPVPEVLIWTERLGQQTQAESPCPSSLTATPLTF